MIKKLKNHNCYHCGYYNKKGHYCNDLDVKVDPNYPVCSEENYYS